MKLYVTILFCSLSIVLSNDLLNTKLNYTVYFRGMEAGEAYLKIQNDTLNNNNVLRLDSKLKTNKFVDLIYKIRDDITIYLDSKDLSLLKVINKINEGSYRKKHSATYNQKLKQMINKSKSINIDIPYSPLSIIYELRNKILMLNDIYNYNIYSMGKINNIKMKVLKNDYVKTSFGNFESIVVSPISNTQKPLIKNNGDMKIWYTNDKNRYPIKIEIKINHGKLILLLNNIES